MEDYMGSFRSSESNLKLTCKQCRARKVRCDGKPGECGGCERLGFQCSFQSDDIARSVPRERLQAETPRRRTSKACRLCRDQKIRCSGTLPQCQNCRLRSRPCTYPTSKRPPRSSAVALLETVGANEFAESSEQLLSPISTTAPRYVYSPRHESTGARSLRNCICPNSSSLTTGSKSAIPPEYRPQFLEIVNSFFENEYPLPSYSFLHPGTTKDRWRAGLLDPSLILAIIGIQALHSQTHTLNSLSRNLSACPCRGEIPIDQAESQIWTNLETPTISRLQALLLIVNHRMQTGHFQRAFMLTATAARFAAAMKLNTERENLTFVASETRRRMVWSLKLVERYFSIGLPEYELCPFEIINLRLPSWEKRFSNGRHLQKPNLDGEIPCDGGSYSICVRLESIRRDIMKLTRSIALCDTAVPYLPDLIRSFENLLGDIGTRMPHGVDLSFDQIQSLLDSPWLPRHIGMYLSWHQCHCDLHRLLLSGYTEAAPSVVLRELEMEETDRQAQMQTAFKDGSKEEGILLRSERLALHHAGAIITSVTFLNQQSPKPLQLEFDAAICVYHATRLLLFISRFGSNKSKSPSAEFAASRAELCLTALRRFFPGSKLVGPIVDELRRSIDGFVLSARDDHMETQKMPSDTAYANSSAVEGAVNTSAPEKAKQRLAVHSLLRQADFSDQDDLDITVNGELEEQGAQGSIPPNLSAKTSSTEPPPRQQFHTVNNSLASMGRNTNDFNAEILREFPSLVNTDNSVSPPYIVHESENNQHEVFADSWDFNILQDQQPDVEFALFPWLGSQELDWYSGNTL